MTKTINSLFFKHLYVLILFALIITNTLFAQSSFIKNDPKSGQWNSANPKFGLNLGTSFFGSSNNQGGMATWINPSLRTNVSKRLSVSFSTTFVQGFNMPVLTLNEEQSRPVITRQNVAYSTVRATGYYQASPSLIIMASAYKQFPLTISQSEANPRALGFGAEGVTVGFHYRVNDHVHISGSVDYSRGAHSGFQRRTYFSDPSYSPFTW